MQQVFGFYMKYRWKISINSCRFSEWNKVLNKNIKILKTSNLSTAHSDRKLLPFWSKWFTQNIHRRNHKTFSKRFIKSKLTNLDCLMFFLNWHCPRLWRYISTFSIVPLNQQTKILYKATNTYKGRVDEKGWQKRKPLIKRVRFGNQQISSCNKKSFDKIEKIFCQTNEEIFWQKNEKSFVKKNEENGKNYKI